MTKQPIAIVHIATDAYEVWSYCYHVREALECYARLRKRPAYIEWLDTPADPTPAAGG